MMTTFVWHVETVSRLNFTFSNVCTNSSKSAQYPFIYRLIRNMWWSTTYVISILLRICFFRFCHRHRRHIDLNLYHLASTRRPTRFSPIYWAIPIFKCTPLLKTPIFVTHSLEYPNWWLHPPLEFPTKTLSLPGIFKKNLSHCLECPTSTLPLWNFQGN